MKSPPLGCSTRTGSSPRSEAIGEPSDVIEAMMAMNHVRTAAFVSFAAVGGGTGEGLRLLGGVEVPRLGSRLEWAHHHPRRIGAQIESLPVQECNVWQRALASLEWDMAFALRGTNLKRPSPRRAI